MNATVCNGGAWRGRRGRRALQPGGAEVKGANPPSHLDVLASQGLGLASETREDGGDRSRGGPGLDRVGLAKGGREGDLNESRAGAGLRPPPRGEAHPRPLPGLEPWSARLPWRAPLAAPLRRPAGVARPTAASSTPSAASRRLASRATFPSPAAFLRPSLPIRFLL